MILMTQFDAMGFMRYYLGKCRLYFHRTIIKMINHESNQISRLRYGWHYRIRPT